MLNFSSAFPEGMGQRDRTSCPHQGDNEEAVFPEAAGSIRPRAWLAPHPLLSPRGKSSTFLPGGGGAASPPTHFSPPRLPCPALPRRGAGGGPARRPGLPCRPGAPSLRPAEQHRAEPAVA